MQQEQLVQQVQSDQQARKVLLDNLLRDQLVRLDLLVRQEIQVQPDLKVKPEQLDQLVQLAILAPREILAQLVQQVLPDLKAQLGNLLLDQLALQALLVQQVQLVQQALKVPHQM